jgi:hypothetical protein
LVFGDQHVIDAIGDSRRRELLGNVAAKLLQVGCLLLRRLPSVEILVGGSATSRAGSRASVAFVDTAGERSCVYADVRCKGIPGRSSLDRVCAHRPTKPQHQRLQSLVRPAR